MNKPRSVSRRRSSIVLATFALGGPLIGAAIPMAVVIVASLLAPSSGLSFLQVLAAIGILYGAILFMAFVTGFGPAVLTGAVAMILRSRLKTRGAYVGLCTLAGLTLSGLFAALLDGLSPAQSSHGGWTYGLVAALGGVAALVCALLTWRPAPRLGT